MTNNNRPKTPTTGGAADLFSIGARLRDIGDGAPADAVERIAYELVRDTDG
jgi:hypothetical protein